MFTLITYIYKRQYNTLLIHMQYFSSLLFFNSLYPCPYQLVLNMQFAQSASSMLVHC